MSCGDFRCWKWLSCTKITCHSFVWSGVIVTVTIHHLKDTIGHKCGSTECNFHNLCMLNNKMKGLLLLFFSHFRRSSETWVAAIDSVITCLIKYCIVDKLLR